MHPASTATALIVSIFWVDRVAQLNTHSLMNSDDLPRRVFMILVNKLDDIVGLAFDRVGPNVGSIED
jgi:hypothetical protein